MTSDGKIGLLISFLFIVTIAFLINGPKGLFKTDKPVIETAVQVPSGRSILIEQAVEEATRELEPVPLRQTQPPTAVQIITPVPTASSAAEPSVPQFYPLQTLPSAAIPLPHRHRPPLLLSRPILFKKVKLWQPLPLATMEKKPAIPEPSFKNSTKPISIFSLRRIFSGSETN